MKKSSLLAVILAVICCTALEIRAEDQKDQEIQDGAIYVLVNRDFDTYENPLHSEFIVNGKTVDIFSSDNSANIDQYIKEGWNDIAIKTTPHGPFDHRNQLVFMIGPMHKDPQREGKYVMSPVLWHFDNGTDWECKKDCIHALGPDVKEVTLTHHLYWTGNTNPDPPLAKGDYLLSVTPRKEHRNPAVVVSVLINGTPFTSFLRAPRREIITSLLKPGKNEVKIVSNRTGIIDDNDVECTITGPAIWSVSDRKFLLKPIAEFKGLQGWKRDKLSGILVNPAAPKSETVTRSIEFMIKEPLPTAPPTPKTDNLETQPDNKKGDQPDKYRSI